MSVATEVLAPARRHERRTRRAEPAVRRSEANATLAGLHGVGQVANNHVRFTFWGSPNEARRLHEARLAGVALAFHGPVQQDDGSFVDDDVEVRIASAVEGRVFEGLRLDCRLDLV